MKREASHSSALAFLEVACAATPGLIFSGGLDCEQLLFEARSDGRRYCEEFEDANRDAIHWVLSLIKDYFARMPTGPAKEFLRGAVEGLDRAGEVTLQLERARSRLASAKICSVGTM